MTHWMTARLACASGALALAAAACGAGDPYGEAFIVCFDEPSGLEGARSDLLAIADDFDLLVGDRSNDARRSAETLGVVLPEREQRDLVMFITDQAGRGVIVADNLTLEADELGVTVFDQNAPQINGGFSVFVAERLSEHGEVHKLPEGTSREAGYCNRFE